MRRLSSGNKSCRPVSFSRVVCVLRLQGSRLIPDPSAAPPPGMWDVSFRLALPSVSGCVLQVESLISELSQCCDTSREEEEEGGSGEQRARPS